MTKQVYFTYKSIGNFCRLLATIQYEKSHTPREITIFHQRFDRAEGDELIEQFLNELFPNGATIGENELIKLNLHIERFMQKDKETQNLFVEYDKRHYSYYVYFKPDNVVYECGFAQHATIIRDICCDYFKGFSEDEIHPQYIEKFIKDNFEIKSYNSTVEQIAKDNMYISRCIILRNKKRKMERNEYQYR
jgi:hypothetical protein